jgi:pyruvate dehydrogenase kinase 2/3/4
VDKSNPLVPGHLHQMLFELVKNSLRAVSDKYADSDEPPPPIRVVIAEGVEDVTIKISDEGGGIRYGPAVIARPAT